MVQGNGLVLELGDNFQKQSNRNRTYIYSPNGVQLLNIPIKHSKEKHQRIKEVRIEPAFDWQKQHFKSLEAAYRSSPFFEYFEDSLLPLFQKKHEFLIDLNLETMALMCQWLRIPFEYQETAEFFHVVPQYRDFRFLVDGKKDPSFFDSYPQVFDDKFGFIGNLSILDLVFNEGKFALDYIRSQKLTSN